MKDFSSFELFSNLRAKIESYNFSTDHGGDSVQSKSMGEIRWKTLEDSSQWKEEFYSKLE